MSFVSLADTINNGLNLLNSGVTTTAPVATTASDDNGTNQGTINLERTTTNIPIEAIKPWQDVGYYEKWDNAEAQYYGNQLYQTLPETVQTDILNEVVMNNDNIETIGELSLGGWSWQDSPTFLGYFPDWQTAWFMNALPATVEVSGKIALPSQTDELVKPVQVADTIYADTTAVSSTSLANVEQSQQTNRKAWVAIAAAIGALLMFS